MRFRAFALLVPLALGLAACGQSDDEAPGGVTVGEAAALNDAAAMLDANSVSTDAVGIEPENHQ